MVNTAPFGVIISFVSTFSNSMGMQKVGYNKRDKAFLDHMRSINKTDWKEDDKPSIFKNWIWWLGIVLMALASLFDFASYALAPASLLAPLASMTLVWNTLLSWKVLGEYIGYKDIFSILVIMAGAILAVVFGDKTAAEYNLEGLIELYDETSTQVYLSVLGSIIVIAMICIKSMSVMLKVDKYACCCTKSAVLAIHPLLYGLVGGLFGGLTSILTKSVGEILSNLLQGDPDGFKHWESYLLIVGMVCSLLLQIRHLNGGLAVYDAMIIVPVYQTFWILASILSGSIYFQEINNFNKTQWVMFPIAICITLIGLWILSACKSKPDKNKESARKSDLPTALTESGRKMSLADAGETIEMGIRVNDKPQLDDDDNNISSLHINASPATQRDANYKPPPPPQILIPTSSKTNANDKKSSPRKKSMNVKSPTKPNSTMNRKKSSNQLNKTPESIKPKNSAEGEEFVTPINIDIPSPDKI